MRHLATWKSDGDGNFLLKEPQAISVDPSGFVYIADTGNQRILKWSPSGSVVSEIGGFGWGADQLDNPVSVWAGNGLDVLVADMNNQRIVRYDKDLHYIASLRSSDSWPEAQRFGFPLDAALGGQSELFCLDGENRRMMKLDVFGNPQMSFGDFDAGEGRLGRPSRFCILRDSRILISDQESFSIKAFDVHGNFLFSFGSGILTKPAGLCEPVPGWLLAADTAQKTVWVFRNFQPQGRCQVFPETFAEPVDVASWKNRVYVLDKKRNAVDLFEWILAP